MRKIFSVLFGITIYCGRGDLPGTARPDAGVYMIGAGMLLDGIGRIINWYQMDRGTEQRGWVLVSAIISLTLGIILMGSDAMQLAMDAFIIYMAIAWLIALGILCISHALRIRKMRNNIRGFQVDRWKLLKILIKSRIILYRL